MRDFFFFEAASFPFFPLLGATEKDKGSIYKSVFVVERRTQFQCRFYSDLRAASVMAVFNSMGKKACDLVAYVLKMQVDRGEGRVKISCDGNVIHSRKGKLLGHKATVPFGIAHGTVGDLVVSGDQHARKLALLQ